MNYTKVTSPILARCFFAIIINVITWTAATAVVAESHKEMDRQAAVGSVAAANTLLPSTPWTARTAWFRSTDSDTTSSSSNNNHFHHHNVDGNDEDSNKAPASVSATAAAAAADTRVGRARRRELQTTVNYTFFGDLTKASKSTGNPHLSCGSFYNICTNGCQSIFYKVTGGMGGTVRATSCGTATFDQEFYVWNGNDTCSSFTCFSAGNFGCVNDTLSARMSWQAQADTAYYVQVWGFYGVTGNYTLSFTSTDPIVVSEVDVCQPSPTLPPTRPPTGVPSHVPSASPTALPSEAPTATPTALPSETPTDLPTAPPTDVPDPCAGVGTTYWLYDPTANVPVRQLINNSATCLLHPYNIEVRPCGTKGSGPVRVRLLGARGDGPPTVVYKSKPQTKAPYLLFGPAPAPGDVLPSPKPLKNGIYYVTAKGAPEWGRLQFTQNCPCPVGKKGCMK